MIFCKIKMENLLSMLIYFYYDLVIQFPFTGHKDHFEKSDSIVIVCIMYAAM